MGVKFLGQFLVDQDYITREDLRAALDVQDEIRLGRLAVEEGILTEAELGLLLEQQHNTDGLLGELALQANLLSTEQVRSLLALQANDRIRLGETLVAQGKLTPEELERALDEYATDQAHYRFDAETLPPSHAERKDIVALVGLTQRMLLRVGGLRSKIELAETYSGPALPLDFGVAITLSGDFEGRYLLGAQESLVRHLENAIAHSDGEASMTDLCDAFGEFASYVVGASASTLASQGHRLRLGVPRSLVGDNHDEPDIAHGLVWGIHTPEGLALVLVE